MTEAQRWWDRHYEEKSFAGGKEPSAFMRRMLPRLQKGRCLDIAMGEGAAACFLAGNGFQVKGFDISDVAVQRAKALAYEKGVTLEAQRADLDMFIFGLMEYDSIVMNFYRPSITRYYSEMIRALKQGGTLLVESRMIEDMKELIDPKEGFRDCFFRTNELIRNLQGMHILYYNEAEEDGHHVLQCLARKPLDKDAVKYGMFDMSTKPKEGPQDVHKKLAEAFFKKP
jgi:SAM-dependent methyltransferase